MASINYSDTKKRGGRGAPEWLISLLSKLGLEGLAGGTGAAGSAVVGTASSGISGLWGGLLATKAGVVALVLAATTVAGGIYVATVPGSVSNFAGGVGGGISSLFAGSSRSPSGAAGGQGAAAGGSQDSIQSFQAANQGQIPDPNQQANASADTYNANNPPSAGSNAPAPDNSYSSGGSARPKLAATQGLNGSNSTGAGGGNLAASLPPGAANGAGANAAVSGHSRSFGGSNQISAAGLTASRRFGPSAGRSAMQQLGATSVVSRAGAASAGGNMASTGYTIDGNARVGAIGGGAGNIAGGGAGVGGAGVGHDGVVNPPTMTKVLPPAPPVGPAENKTPWQGAMMAAMGAMAVALGAFMMMRMFKKKALEALNAGLPGAAAFHSAMAMAKMMGMIAMAAGAVATMMGLLIMTAYGQKNQGMIWTVTGGIFTAIATYSWFHLESDRETKAKEEALKNSEKYRDDIQNKFNVRYDHGKWFTQDGKPLDPTTETKFADYVKSDGNNQLVKFGDVRSGGTYYQINSPQSAANGTIIQPSSDWANQMKDLQSQMKGFQSPGDLPLKGITSPTGSAPIQLGVPVAPSVPIGYGQPYFGSGNQIFSNPPLGSGLPVLKLVGNKWV